MPYFPNVPVSFPLYVEPKLSAASSTNGTLCLLHISKISSIFAGVPYKCTKTTAFGLGYISNAFSKAFGSIFQVSLSESINTGVAS